MQSRKPIVRQRGLYCISVRTSKVSFPGPVGPAGNGTTPPAVTARHVVVSVSIRCWRLYLELRDGGGAPLRFSRPIFTSPACSLCTSEATSSRGVGGVTRGEIRAVQLRAHLVRAPLPVLLEAERPRSEQGDGRRGLLTAAAPEVTLTLVWSDISGTRP